MCVFGGEESSFHSSGCSRSIIEIHLVPHMVLIETVFSSVTQKASLQLEHSMFDRTCSSFVLGMHQSQNSWFCGIGFGMVLPVLVLVLKRF